MDVGWRNLSIATVVLSCGESILVLPNNALPLRIPQYGSSDRDDPAARAGSRAAKRSAMLQFEAYKPPPRKNGTKLLLNQIALLNTSPRSVPTAGEPRCRKEFMSAVSLDRDPLAETLSPERRATLEKLFYSIGTVATLPSAAHRILELSDADAGDPVKLREVVQTDPVLVARILRRLNSSYYALSHRVADIRTAVSLLGVREVRNLALTVYMSRIFERKGDYKTYKRAELWNHSVAVATTCRLVSRVCGRGNTDEVYIAGLLHDIGLILLDQSLRRHFCKIIDELTPGMPAYLLEQRALTFDHAGLGGFVARKWNFPDQIADAIAYHHEPLLYKGEHKDLVHIVTVANFLCSRAGVSSLGVHNIPPPPDEVYQGLGLDQVALAIIWDQMEVTLEKAEAMAKG